MTCKRCDGWIDIMDPDHSGAVIGARECPDCGGTGKRDDFLVDTDFDEEGEE